MTAETMRVHIPGVSSEILDAASEVIEAAGLTVSSVLGAVMARIASDKRIPQGMLRDAEEVQTLGSGQPIMLDEQQWRAFHAALERPPVDKPKLKKLLTEPGVLG